MIKLNEAPTFEQWMNAKTDLICDVIVNLKRNEGKQKIKNCIIYFGINKDIRITKRGYLVNEYFFVDSIESTFNYREGSNT